MEEKIVLKSTFKNNLWVSKSIVGCNIIAVIIWYCFLKIYGSTGLFVLLGFLDIILLGIVGIVIHKQYFSFEKNRIINITKSKAEIFCKEELVKEIYVKDVIRVILIDKIIKGVNSFPTFMDSYYYIVILIGDGSYVMITCLMDPLLKNKIKAWSNVEMEHKNIFFPFLKLNSIDSLFK